VLHLRVVSPVPTTDAVLRVFADEPGATHLVLLRGAALAPAGDLVEADVARESADAVFAALCALGIAVGFPLAMLVTAVGAALGSWANLFEVGVLRGEHSVDFVYKLGWWSFIVAVLAGAAGMLSMTSTKSAALVGVFISVTTVPAAGYAAVAAILGEWPRFFESVGQLVVNMLGIVLSATVVLLLRKGSWRVVDRGRPLSTG
jgi:hypothetical protein